MSSFGSSFSSSQVRRNRNLRSKTSTRRMDSAKVYTSSAPNPFAQAFRRFFSVGSPSSGSGIKTTRYFMKRELCKHNDKNTFINLTIELLLNEILAAGYLVARDLCNLRGTCKAMAFGYLMPYTEHGEMVWKRAYLTTYGEMANCTGARQRNQSYFWECAKLHVYAMHAELRNMQRGVKLCAALAKLPPGMVIGPVGSIGNFSDPRVAMTVSKRRPQAVFAIGIQSTKAAVEFRRRTSYAQPVSFVALDAISDDGRSQCVPIDAPGFLGYAVELVELSKEDEYLRWTLLFNAYRHLSVWQSNRHVRAFIDEARRTGHPAVDEGHYVYYATLDTHYEDLAGVEAQMHAGPRNSLPRLYDRYVPETLCVENVRIPVALPGVAKTDLNVGDLVVLHGESGSNQLRGRITRRDASGMYFDVSYETSTRVKGTNIPRESLVPVADAETAFERWCQVGAISMNTAAFGPWRRKRLFATANQPLEEREAKELMDAMTLTGEDGIVGHYADMMDSAADLRSSAVYREFDRSADVYEIALESFQIVTKRYHRGASYFRENPGS